MASGGDAAALAASCINQEQLLHDLESKYLSLKSDFALVESERQTLAADKQAALEKAERVAALAEEHEKEARELKQQLLQVTTEKDGLTFKLQTTTSLAERRLAEVEELQTTVREQNKALVDAQRQEMQALERAAKQEAQVAPLMHALTRAKKETEAAQQHSQWLETQLNEKTRTVQELRHELTKHTHDLEELKIRSTEELTSVKRQLESARLTNKKMEGALVKSTVALKELQASKLHDEEVLQNELNAQRRLASLYQESAAEASARVTELQKVCDSLRESLSESEQALARETEQAKKQVEHLFREQAEASEARIQALQDDLQHAKQKAEEMEKKKVFSLQTASAAAELSLTVSEAHLAAHGLTPTQMYDQIVKLEETLQAERKEKDKVQLYMDRIVKEIHEKAPILMGLRLDHERIVASHTQLSERLEQCMQELAKGKTNEQHAREEKLALEKKCELLGQSVDDLSRQVQHLLFRAQGSFERPDNFESGDVGSENLLVFKDVKELQVRNQQLLTVVRELTEMNKSTASKSGTESADSTAHVIVASDLDDNLDEVGASSAIKKRLSMASKEIQELRNEREQEREMISAIVKQRDMYRVLLAQSDTKFVEGGASASSVGALETSSSAGNRRGPFDMIESDKLREVQTEFEDYKMEKQTNLRLLQEALDQERARSSESRLAQMQAQVEAACNRERYEASEERCANAENELARLRSKTDQLSSLMLQHQHMLSKSEAKLESAALRVQSLTVERDSAVREVDFLRKNEEKIQQELITVRLDNTNLLKLMESTRRMESGREERDRREVEILSKKVTTLETKLQDAYEKLDAKEATCGAQVLAVEREKQAAVSELTKLKEAHGQLKEQFARLEEQKKALDDKFALLEKEAAHMREQLRKGASVAAAERVAALEVQLRDAQREVQASLVSRKTLTESLTKYKVLAEASEKSLAELSSASEKWKQSEAEKMQELEKSRAQLKEDLVKARVDLKEHVVENNSLREEIDRAEKTHKQSIAEATEKQKMLQLQADSATQQMNSAREEMVKMKNELETTRENYERELQLHAVEVSKSSTARREVEQVRKTVREREAEIEALNVKVELVEKETQLQLERLQKRVDEAVEAKNAIAEQNKLLHSQLERAAAQVRRAHEQDMLKMVNGQASASNQEAGEGAVAPSVHEKEIDDLRSVVAYLRRESEITESKLELSQQEVQRSRAEVFSLESTIKRLRGEIKALTDSATAADKQTIVVSPDDQKRAAQLEQLSLLRESNATLRDENQKNLAKFKEESTKVRSLEAKLVPLQNAETALKMQVASLKQEVETLNDANKRWKQRVDQLVEKYQQIDPAEHDKVVAEKEALTKELAELKAEQTALKNELETLRSCGGKELEEEKKKVENWTKQYERIKGFAKNWKNKAEMLTKQLAEKNKEMDDRTSTISALEARLSSVQAQVNIVATEKAALEAKLSACEAAKQESVVAASGATTSWEKERLALKTQLELETKKSSQLKDFNARLMSGLRSLKKENSDLKDHAASASQLVGASEKTPKPSPPPSPPQVPLSAAMTTTTTTTVASPAKPASAPTPLFLSPTPTIKTEPVEERRSAVSSEADKSVTESSVAAVPAAHAAPSSAPTSSVSAVSTMVITTVSDAMPTSVPPANASTSMPTVPAPVQPTPAAALVPTMMAPSTEARPKESIEKAAEKADGMTAEETLRQFALRSIKKQVEGAARLVPAQAPVPPADVEAQPVSRSETVSSESSGPFNVGASTSFGAFGSGGPSGLVFGKPGISLPVPSPPSPGASPLPHLSLAGESVPPESLRRSQRLARFAAGGDGAASSSAAGAAAPAIIDAVGSALTKRPSSSGVVEESAPVQKVAKTGEDQSTKTTTVATTTTTTARTTTLPTTTTSEEKQEEDSLPAQVDSTESHSTPPTQ